MADEHTMSTITWRNVLWYSLQNVGTLEDHIKICQWHCYNPQVNTNISFLFCYWYSNIIYNGKSPFQPVIHWCNMDVTTSNSSHKRNISKLQLNNSEDCSAHHAPPQPQPFDLYMPNSELDDDSDIDTTGEEGSMATHTINDGAHWLDTKLGLRGRAVYPVHQWLVLTGVDDFKLSSPYFCSIFNEGSKSHFQTTTETKGAKTLPKIVLKAVPSPINWDTW